MLRSPPIHAQRQAAGTQHSEQVLKLQYLRRRSEMQWIEHWLAHADSPRQPTHEEQLSNDGLQHAKSMGPHIRRARRFQSGFAASSSGTGSPSSRMLDPEDEDDDDNDSMDPDNRNQSSIDSNGNQHSRHHKIDLGEPAPGMSEQVGPVVL